jgi:hypothetical protein
MIRLSLLLALALVGCKKEVVETDCNDGFDDDLDGAVDCDDSDCSSLPVCNDTIDTDQETGHTDTDTGPTVTDLPLSGAGMYKFIGELTGDWAGFSVDAKGDLNGDGKADYVIGAYNADREGLLDAGATYVVYGPLTGDKRLASADAILQGKIDKAEMGRIVRFAGDLNNDGKDDLLVGAPRASIGSVAKGVVYVLYGALAGKQDIRDAGKTLRGSEENDYAGIGIDGVGDVNGDGFDDFLVGADRSDAAAENAGQVYLEYGPIDRDGNLEEAAVVITGAEKEDRLGTSVSKAGDVDGDGTTDFVLGASQSSYSAVSAGSAYLFYGPLTGSISATTADARFDGEFQYALAGQFVGDCGDFSGDGYDDFVVGAFQDTDNGSQSGAVYVIHGGSTRRSGDKELWAADLALKGTTAFDRLGHAITCPGDLDNDGNKDIVVGAFGSDSGLFERGVVYAVYGPVDGTHDVLTKTRNRYLGAESDDWAGHQLASAGDVNADGKADFLIGAPKSNSNGADSGTVYLVFGR